MLQSMRLQRRARWRPRRACPRPRRSVRSWPRPPNTICRRLHRARPPPGHLQVSPSSSAAACSAGVPCWVRQQCVHCFAASSHAGPPSRACCAEEATAIHRREAHTCSVAPSRCLCTEAARTHSNMFPLARLQRSQPGLCRSGRHNPGKKSVPNISVLPARLKACGVMRGRRSMLHACGCIGQ